jgi:hypothetical protein
MGVVEAGHCGTAGAGFPIAAGRGHVVKVAADDMLQCEKKDIELAIWKHSSSLFVLQRE